MQAVVVQPGFGQPWVGSRWMAVPVLVGRKVRSPRWMATGSGAVVAGGWVGVGEAVLGGWVVAGGWVGVGDPDAGGWVVAGGRVVGGGSVGVGEPGPGGCVVGGACVVGVGELVPGGWVGSPGAGGGLVSGTGWNVNASSRVRLWSTLVRNLTCTSTVAAVFTAGMVTSIPVLVTVPRTMARSPNHTYTGTFGGTTPVIVVCPPPVTMASRGVMPSSLQSPSATGSGAGVVVGGSLGEPEVGGCVVVGAGVGDGDPEPGGWVVTGG